MTNAKDTASRKEQIEAMFNHVSDNRFKGMYINMQQHIDAVGLSLMAVPGLVVYSIGLRDSLGFDIICTANADPRDLMPMMNWVAKELTEKPYIGGTVIVEVTEELKIGLREVQVSDKMRDNFVAQAGNFYHARDLTPWGEGLRFVQVVLSDNAGNLPWEDGYDIELEQPVFKPLTTH